MNIYDDEQLQILKIEGTHGLVFIAAMSDSKDAHWSFLDTRVTQCTLIRDT